jgi:hypothetical protein
MAVTAEISELMSSYVEDIFSFPSSPDQIVAFSPPESETEDVVEHIYHANNKYPTNNKVYVPQKPTVETIRVNKRKLSVPAVPVMEAPRKRFANENNTISFTTAPAWVNEISDVSSFSHSMKAFQPNVLNSPLAMMQQPFAIQPSTITPSRIKSTTPNLALLFSLFDVLDEEETAWSSPSSTSSPESSQGSYNGNFVDVNQNGHHVPQFETNVIYINTTTEQLLMNQNHQHQQQRIGVSVPAVQNPMQHYVEANPNISSPPACVPDCDLPNSPQSYQVMQQFQHQMQHLQPQEILQQQQPHYQQEEANSALPNGNSNDNYVVPNVVYCYQQPYAVAPMVQRKEGSERAVMLSSFADHLN